MYENSLSSIMKKEELGTILNEKTVLQSKSNQKFHEILCPKSGREINSGECVKCSHKDEYKRAHPTGFLLTMFICNWEHQRE